MGTLSLVKIHDEKHYTYNLSFLFSLWTRQRCFEMVASVPVVPCARYHWCNIFLCLHVSKWLQGWSLSETPDRTGGIFSERAIIIPNQTFRSWPTRAPPVLYTEVTTTVSVRGCGATLPKIDSHGQRHIAVTVNCGFLQFSGTSMCYASIAVWKIAYLCHASIDCAGKLQFSAQRGTAGARCALVGCTKRAPRPPAVHSSAQRYTAMPVHLTFKQQLSCIVHHLSI